jgi:hypothetical protein
MVVYDKNQPLMSRRRIFWKQNAAQFFRAAQKKLQQNYAQKDDVCAT